jgi:outer membrane protein OmpA-like peptidoglycan-associated protein
MVIRRIISILFISLLLGIINPSYAQQENLQNIVNQGVNLTNQDRNKEAATFFTQAYAIDSNSVFITNQLALALWNSQQYERALPILKKTIENDTSQSYSESKYRYALCLQQIHEYQLALTEFEKLRMHIFELGTDTLRIELKNINREIEACKYSLLNQTQTEAIVTQLPPPINTIYSEFNPVPIAGDRLYYSSYYPVFQDSFNSLFSDLYISELFMSRLTSTGWQIEEKPNKRINNRKDHNGNVTVSRNGQRIYFSRCKDVDGQPGNCKIYQAEKSGDNWTKVKALPQSVNAPNSSNTHPHLVETRTHDILYYTSNRKDGYGGEDLWYVIIKDGKISEANNLGSKINTIGNEITPSYDKANSILYFSSDFHDGFGGFDIFQSSGGLNSWTAPLNLGAPINSNRNDLYFIKDGYNEAYLSSNRKGALHAPNAEYCCNDIYHVVLSEVENQTDSIPEITNDTTVFTVERQIQDLLPISLYFHNDQPNPKTTQTTTQFNYQELLTEYVGLKENYKIAYSENLDSTQAIKAKADIEDFFNSYVENGFDELNKLTSLLLKELQSGKHVRIVVKGYASPLNSSEYNYYLSKRRIASLINYLKIYQDGIFIPYLEGTASDGGKLSIYEDPKGDSQASEVVSDNPNDKRNSIYSRSAALERKIQIVRYQSTEDSLNSIEYPILSLSKDTIYIDSLRSNENKTLIVPLRNDGETELKIKSIESSCPCLQFQIRKRNIESSKEEKLYLLIKGSDLSTDTPLFIKIQSNTENEWNIIRIIIN